MNDTVLARRDGAIAWLTLNRPAALNTLDFAMIDALVAQTAALAVDPAVRVVIVGGAGRHFMAGGDIRTFAEELGQPSAARRACFQRMVERLHTAVETLHRLPQVIVGRVQGAVAGFGLSLMNACDLVVAADDAYFAAAYRHIALSPDGGGSWSLPRLVGLRRAMEIMLVGERFDAAEALRMGLVNRVVPLADLDAATQALAQSIATGPATAIARTRRLLRDSLSNTLSEHLQAEAVSFGLCTAEQDFAEGIDAFLAKRAPKFGGGDV